MRERKGEKILKVCDTRMINAGNDEGSVRQWCASIRIGQKTVRRFCVFAAAACPVRYTMRYVAYRCDVMRRGYKSGGERFKALTIPGTRPARV